MMDWKIKITNEIKHPLVNTILLISALFYISDLSLPYVLISNFPETLLREVYFLIGYFHNFSLSFQLPAPISTVVQLQCVQYRHCM